MGVDGEDRWFVWIVICRVKKRKKEKEVETVSAQDTDRFVRTIRDEELEWKPMLTEGMRLIKESTCL